ncbi:hypothetical protein WME92_16040 [Sorangium sp. So ce307]
MAEVLADPLERPVTAPPAGDERAGAGVAEVVPADRTDDARGGEVAVEEVDLLLLPAAGAGRGPVPVGRVTISLRMSDVLPLETRPPRAPGKRRDSGLWGA